MSGDIEYFPVALNKFVGGAIESDAQVRRIFGLLHQFGAGIVEWDAEEGNGYDDTAVTSRLNRWKSSPYPQTVPHWVGHGWLSAREREVLALIAEGLSNAGITHRLWATEGTVEKQVRSIDKAELAEDRRR